MRYDQDRLCNSDSHRSAFTGSAGAVGTFFRRLTSQALEEAQAKEAIGRLFGEFVSPDVREKILREKADLVGERRSVAVLFSDIRGFSSFSEGRAPEAVMNHLNAYFQAMVSPIERQGGVVDKFIGDAIMAVFGGVVDHDAPCQGA